MTKDARVWFTCPDRVGLVAAVTARLFDLGGNLGDTTFAVLSGAAEFSSVVEFPAGTDLEHVAADLKALPSLDGADVTVTPQRAVTGDGPSTAITHHITLSGGDRPGLVARLSEAFVDFRANIVRLQAERVPGPAGVQYAVQIALSVPAETATSCLATVANTAGSLSLACHIEEA